MRLAWLLIGTGMLLSAACTSTDHERREESFSKADTITDQLLVLQDSLHHRWLRVSMHEQLHNVHLQELFDKTRMFLHLPEPDQKSIEDQISQLHQLQLNPRNITNPDVIHEHDLARHALTTDIFHLIESHQLHRKDSAIAQLAYTIQGFQERTWQIRMRYDSLALHHNQFLMQHLPVLLSGDPEADHKPRPLFQAVFKK